MMKARNQNELEVPCRAVCRSPLFPIDTTLDRAWPTLKRLIRDSAPEFYPIIAELEAEDLAAQSEKVRFTVWKYFNRSRYRATPFGEFASVSLVPIGGDGGTITLEQQMQVLARPDWKAVQQIDYKSRSLVRANFRTNPLCYVHGQEFHYLYRGQKQFELNAIGRREDIDLLLDYCRTLRSFDELALLVWDKLAMKKRSLLALLKQLLELQALECDLQANITGEDYFVRTQQAQTTGQGYAIASRSHLGGGLQDSIAGELKDYARFISRCLWPPSNPLLEQFKSSFLQLWEQRSVPLSLALDPILGIGYGNAAEMPQDGVVGKLQQRIHGEEVPRIAYGAFEQFVLSKLAKGGAIQLADFKPAPSAQPLPNTVSILFHIYHGHAVIHQAGGATATALLGRFTAIEGIRELSLSLSEIEQASNPGAVFFDLAYQFEGRTDNVNRREHLYATELPIGSWSTLAEPLRLEDIIVSVSEGQILLHHARSGARLVPRLASAYNHGRSDLDLFRFLCDLQYQGIQSRLGLDLQAMFPHLEHYPRVYFQETIACAAKWRLPQSVSAESLPGWLAALQITHPFTVGKGDQTLVIDPAIAADLNFLAMYRKQQQSGDIYLTEWGIFQKWPPFFSPKWPPITL
ncbi:lantibiotic dehydratase [Pedobacter sp.]